MTVKQELAKLQEQAAQYQGTVKARLAKMMAGTLRSQAQSNQERAGGTIQRTAGGGVLVKGGMPIGDQEALEYIRLTGGNPYTKEMQALQSSGDMSGTPTKGNRSVSRTLTAQEALAAQETQETPQELLTRFLEEMQAKAEERETDDRARETKILEERGALRDRSLKRVENYGKARGELINEQYDERLGDYQGDLASMGFGNSTRGPAFEMRNNRDRDLVLQDLAEQVDARTMNTDIALTESLEDFRERPTYSAPDFSQALSLAQMLGRGNDGQGFRDEQYKSLQDEIANLKSQQTQPQQQFDPWALLNQYGSGVSPYAAQQIQGDIGSAFNFANAYSGFNSAPGAPSGGYYGTPRPRSENSVKRQAERQKKTKYASDFRADWRRMNYQGLYPKRDAALGAMKYYLG